MKHHLFMTNEVEKNSHKQCYIVNCSSLGKLWIVSDHLPGEWLLLFDDKCASTLASLIILTTSLAAGRFSGTAATLATAISRRAPIFSSDPSLLDAGSSPDSVSASRMDRTHPDMSGPCSCMKSWKGVFPVRSSSRRIP